MRLSKLIKCIQNIKIYNYRNTNISNLSINDNSCTKGSMFFALPGVNVDGNKYIKNAIKNGAVCIVSNRYNSDIKCPQIISNNPRQLLSIISNTFYGKPDKRIKIIAIVGSNGKTTSSYMLYNMLRFCDKSVGVIGTLGVVINGTIYSSDMTTPDSIELNYYLNQMVSLGCEYCILEVSAHAIFLDKVYGIKFHCALFTNISPEHLDFFKSYKQYIDTKLNFLVTNKFDFIVTNSDDLYGARLIQDSQCKCIAYGIYSPADNFAINIKTHLKHSTFVVNICDTIASVNLNMPGEYNVYNALGALSVACKLGLNIDDCVGALNCMQGVSGRMEFVDLGNDRIVVSDFAHTPDGYAKVFSHVSHHRTGRIISLFGFVEYADSEKRKEMMKLAAEYSHLIIFTQDNPNYANFDDDCRIFDGCNKVEFIGDRTEAIRHGMSILLPHDTLLCLGKGGESKQKIKGKNYYYNELEVINQIKKEL